MYSVRNNRELREAYSLVRDFGELTQSKKVRDIQADIKRGIRRYIHKQSDRRIVDDAGVDGYTVLIEMPLGADKSEEEAEEWFLENEYRECVPSAYDCTGQMFTRWHKLARRRGHWYCYHAVRFDV